MIFCIDGGTTHTRVRLMNGDTEADSVKLQCGSSAKDNSELRSSVKSAIETLLSRNGLKESDIEKTVASGMITSEFGLYELPHVTLPAGVKELALSSKKIVFDDISSIPFLFTPGVKNNTDVPDMMRGEETECLGLCDDCGRCFSDAEGKNEIFDDDIVIGKIDDDLNDLRKALLINSEYSEAFDVYRDGVVDVRDYVMLKILLADNTAPLGSRNTTTSAKSIP